MGPTEFVYYWLHRALHLHSLYAKYHSHHHASFVPEAVTGSVHPFMEHLMYTANFAVIYICVICEESTKLGAGDMYPPPHMTCGDLCVCHLCRCVSVCLSDLFVFLCRLCVSCLCFCVSHLCVSLFFVCLVCCCVSCVFVCPFMQILMYTANFAVTTCMCVRAHAHARAHTHTSDWICVFVCVCVCVCVYRCHS